MQYSAAVIGLGNIGFKFSCDQKRKGTWTHVDAYAGCPSTALVGAVEIDKETIDLFHLKYPDIPVYSTVKDLFSATQGRYCLDLCADPPALFNI